MVQNALKDGRLKFHEKLKARLQGELNPKVEEALFIEHVDVFMMDVSESTEVVKADYQEKMMVVFPKTE